MGRDEIISKLRGALPELNRRYGVSGLMLFGSWARGDSRTESDVDLLAEFDRPTSLFDLAGLNGYLERLLERPVDVGPADALRPHMRDEVMAEACRVA